MVRTVGAIVVSAYSEQLARVPGPDVSQPQISEYVRRWWSPCGSISDASIYLGPAGKYCTKSRPHNRRIHQPLRQKDSPDGFRIHLVGKFLLTTARHRKHPRRKETSSSCSSPNTSNRNMKRVPLLTAISWYRHRSASSRMRPCANLQRGLFTCPTLLRRESEIANTCKQRDSV